MNAFIGPHGVRAGWRLFLFAVIAALFAILFGVAATMVGRIDGRSAAAIFNNYTLGAAALLAMWIMQFVEGRPVWDYGFAAPNRGRNFAAGLAAGIVALSVLMGLLAAAGAYRPGPPSIGAGEAVRWGFYWAVLFAGVGLSEESIIRGYPLFSVSQGIGFWPAAALLSVAFGAGHIANNGEEWIGIANAMIAGLVLAYGVKWTGSLWWGIGFHLTWDWGESFFYGVADSGSKAQHSFLSWSPAGPAWLSGGSVGPEGSILASIVLLALAAAVRFTTPRWDNPALERLRPVPRPLPVDDAENPGGISVT